MRETECVRIVDSANCAGARKEREGSHVGTLVEQSVQELPSYSSRSHHFEKLTPLSLLTAPCSSQCVCRKDRARFFFEWDPPNKQECTPSTSPRSVFTSSRGIDRFFLRSAPAIIVSSSLSHGQFSWRAPSSTSHCLLRP